MLDSAHVTVTITQEDDRYVAVCNENHVSSFGSTVDEALRMIAEALELWFSEMTQFPELYVTASVNFTIRVERG
ncbi:MAG TPA: hypothetical protein VHU91_02145 [Mycobacteriales bacterium]|nr:hypothetical protein [Mycobacteriales bacterium]